MSAGARCGIDLNPAVDSYDPNGTADDETSGTPSDESIGVSRDGPTGVASGESNVSTSDESIGTAVVSAVADAKGVDPLDLDPLYDVIDADAVDAIFSEADGSSSLELRFSMAGCDVVVHGAGEVSVTPPTRQGAAGAALSRGD